MILIVTNKDDHTADYLILELQRRGTPFFRLNTEDLPQHATIDFEPRSESLGTLRCRTATFPLHDVTSIWYRRPATPVPAPTISDPAARDFATAETQAALDGALAALDAFWVSHPHLIRRAEHKPFQLRIAQNIGFSIPDTLVTNSPASAQRFLETHPAVVYKPLRRGRLVTTEGTRLIFTSPVPRDATMESIRYAPALLQEHVPKRYDIRATVIGDTCLAVAIHSQESTTASTDWRRAEPGTIPHEVHTLPNDISDQCRRLVRMLGLAFGAIDLILTPQGQYVFLEVNPNGQWAWLQQRCPELPLRETLADLLTTPPAP